MIVEKLLRKIHSRSVIGCSVALVGNEMVANACLLKRERKKVSLIQSYPGLDLSKLSETFGPKIPLVLSFTGESVITRSVQTVSDTERSKVFSVHFPHIKQEEFVIQVYQVNEESALFSFVRRSEVELVLSAFANAGVKVYDFFLGPFAIDCLIGAEDSRTLDVANYNIRIVDGRIADLQRRNFEAEDLFEIGTVSIPQRLTIAYASALSFFVDEQSPIEKTPNNYLHLQEQYYGHAIFQSILHRVAPALFIIALFATGVNLYYSAKVQQLSEMQLLNNVRQQTENRSKTELKNASALINELQWNRAAFSSYYADRLAKLVPNRITIDRLEIFPHKFRNDSRRDSFFDPTTIQVVGTTDKPETLALWVHELTNQSWVKSINEKNYQWDQNRVKGNFSFQIILNSVN
jgi:hypothetical protein